VELGVTDNKSVVGVGHISRGLDRCTPSRDKLLHAYLASQVTRQ